MVQSHLSPENHTTAGHRLPTPHHLATDQEEPNQNWYKQQKETGRFQGVLNQS